MRFFGKHRQVPFIASLISAPRPNTSQASRIRFLRIHRTLLLSYKSPIIFLFQYTGYKLSRYSTRLVLLAFAIRSILQGSLLACLWLISRNHPHSCWRKIQLPIEFHGQIEFDRKQEPGWTFPLFCSSYWFLLCIFLENGLQNTLLKNECWLF